MKTENKPVLSKTEEILIDNMKYIVTTRFKENGRETAEQKLLRYVIKHISEEIDGNSALT